MSIFIDIKLRTFFTLVKQKKIWLQGHGLTGHLRTVLQTFFCVNIGDPEKVSRVLDEITGPE
jgi:hypothetical protein